MQNPYSSIAFKIIQRLYPNPKASSCRMILAFYSTGSKNDQNLCNADKSIAYGDQKGALQGKIALITGGAQGIGFDIAQTLLRNGVKGITIVDNDCECGAKSYACLSKEYGKESAMFCACDVTKTENMDGAFRKTIKHFKGLDMVINNAGIFNDRKWENEIAVNIGGCVIGSLLGLQYMSKSCLAKGGVILNIGNTAGIEPLSGCPIYTMTQSAIIGFTRTLGSGSQYQRTGVKVIGLCAGPTHTRMMKNVSSRAINEHFAKELVNELKDRQVQPKSFVSDGILKVLREGKNGSIWVAHNCKEAFQLCFPPSIENMQIPTMVTEKDKKSRNLNFNSEVSKAEKKGNNINIESKSNLVYNMNTGKCPEQPKLKDQGPINLYAVHPKRKKILPEHLNQSTDYDWIQCPPSSDSKEERLIIEPLLLLEMEPKKTAPDIIEAASPPSNKRLETGGSKELGVPISSSVKPELNPSIFEPRKAEFKSEIKDKSKESGHIKEQSRDSCKERHIVSCVDTNRNIGSAEEVKRNEHDASKTIELCEELKNMLSPASKQSKQSAKEACRLKNLEQIQKTQLSFPYPPPEHPKHPCDQAMKIEQMDKARDAKPKVLEDCQNKIDKQCSKKCTNITSKLNDKIMSEEEMKKQSDLCKERDSPQQFKDICSVSKQVESSEQTPKEMKLLKSIKKDLNKDEPKQLNNCEKDDSKKMDPNQAIKPEKEIIRNKKNVDKRDNANDLETHPTQKNIFDGIRGRCKLVRREIDNTPLKISYDSKPIPSLLPEHLNGPTTNKSKNISKATQKLPQQESSQAQTALEKAKNTTSKAAIDTSDKPDHDDPRKNKK